MIIYSHFTFFYYIDCISHVGLKKYYNLQLVAKIAMVDI